jgi:gas vesicle protein
MTKSLYYLFAGAGIGFGVTLLWAPKSGRDTRKLLSKKVSRGKEFVSQGVESATDIYEKGLDRVTRAGDAVTSAVSAGKHAFLAKI